MSLDAAMRTWDIPYARQGLGEPLAFQDGGERSWDRAVFSASSDACGSLKPGPGLSGYRWLRSPRVGASLPISLWWRPVCDDNKSDRMPGWHPEPDVSGSGWDTGGGRLYVSVHWYHLLPVELGWGREPC